MIIFGQNGRLSGPNAVPNEILTQWAGERLGIKDFGPCVTIGILHKGQIAAVALYNKYLHPNIEITFVIGSPHWASPGAVRAILSYPFKALHCKRITATIDARNERAARFLRHLGFVQEGYHPDVFEDGDAATYGLLRKNATRWLNEQTATSRAA